MTIISGLCSLLAISLLSPVQSIVALICLFISVAIGLYSNGYILMGILYILIYVGAIAILFLFILSLLNIDYKYTGSIHPLILTILLICLIPLDLTYSSTNYHLIENLSPIIYNDWDLELMTVGSILYTEYAIPMILIGIILILAVIGAIGLTK
ncbi:unnamed protein product (mitochondrion) [Lodderomyces beijingensis]|uniref:NADH-ubiquinone oxidoreductase chain 6 n=1 Tax=Lodderomyces beijingensis TaxID=1775926 RepID=A0ABP0ZUW4_9ASCO